MSYTTTTSSSAADGLEIVVHRWGASGEPRGIVQIAHGVAEHSLRYERLADALRAAGYIVYANDHRGHGASVSAEVPLGSFGPAGWPALVADAVALSERIRSEEGPDLPLFLVAHSMGSFAAQEILLDESARYAGVVLSGTTALDLMAQALAAAGDGPVDLTMFNAPFEHRTGYEWLSRDTAEVDRYVADPLSGFDLADDTIPQLFSAAGRLADPAALAGIRSDLPVLIVSGQDDPLAGGGALVEAVAARYREAGIEDVTLTVLPGARHEIFNETNRDEITADVIRWLDAHR
jgi:alpha-beta hydrolase superfamily lysophospholipase